MKELKSTNGSESEIKKALGHWNLDPSITSYGNYNNAPEPYTRISIHEFVETILNPTLVDYRCVLPFDPIDKVQRLPKSYRGPLGVIQIFWSRLAPAVGVESIAHNNALFKRTERAQHKAFFWRFGCKHEWSEPHLQDPNSNVTSAQMVCKRCGKMRSGISMRL